MPHIHTQEVLERDLEASGRHQDLLHLSRREQEQESRHAEEDVYHIAPRRLRVPWK